MADKIYDYVIVGAGFSGLHLADHLKNHRNKEVLVLEKSRGVGGRMATRRDGEFTFDHGAQFIKNDELMNPSIKRWIDKGLLRPFSSDHFSAIGGMTKLAKDLSVQLNIELERKVNKITWLDNKWLIEDDQTHSWFAHQVIVTAPVPQILELLERSSIKYPKDLQQIHYAKALVFITKGESSIGESAYREISNSSIFSVSSQKLKGTSSSPCQVVVMGPEWSNTYFDESDEVIMKLGREVLKKELPELLVDDLQLKKWRYAFPLNVYHQDFLALENGLYLAGDGFSESRLNGALKSAKSLMSTLVLC